MPCVVLCGGLGYAADGLGYGNLGRSLMNDEIVIRAFAKIFSVSPYRTW
jgi:hypothetical protein